MLLKRCARLAGALACLPPAFWAAQGLYCTFLCRALPYGLPALAAAAAACAALAAAWLCPRPETPGPDALLEAP